MTFRMTLWRFTVWVLRRLSSKWLGMMVLEIKVILKDRK